MKIVQSLWSKPGQIASGKYFDDYNRCGWLEKKYNYYSWALSLHQLKQYYDDVELVTDRKGYELLIEKLQLPYSSVKVVLDDIDPYHKDLFALGKIYAYSIQDKPFIHVDGDVYIWEKFVDDEKINLICQNKEEGINYEGIYNKIYIPIVQHLPYCPAVLDWAIEKNDCIRAINAGILGGSNTDFIKSFCDMAFNFVNKNIKDLHKINIRQFNIIFEQFLFCAMAQESNQSIKYYFEDAYNHAFAFDFTGAPSRVKYLHMCGLLKTDKNLGDWLGYRLVKDYPDCFYNIQNLLKKNEI